MTRWSAVLLGREATLSVASRTVRTGTRSTAHRRRAHTEAGGCVHRRGEGAVSDNGSSRTARTAAQAGRVLGEVVVATAVLTTLPVTSTEGNHASTSTHVATTHAMSMTVAAYVVLGRAHHTRVTIAVTTISHWITTLRSTLLHCWERAAEACSSSLEVGETA